MRTRFRLPYSISRVLCVGVMLCCILRGLPLRASPSSYAPWVEGRTVGNYQLVSSQREKRARIWQYTYTVDVTNNGATTAWGVTATATSLVPTTRVIQGTLDCGDIAPGATQTCKNPVVLRIDRRYPLTDTSLAWSLTKDDLHALAMRFRPYLKYSRDLSDYTGTVTDEPIRPSTWQWYVQHSDLHQLVPVSCSGGHCTYSDQIKLSNTQLVQNLTSFEDVTVQGGYNFDVRQGGSNQGASLQFAGLPTSEYYIPPAWNDTTYGMAAGAMYAHAENIFDRDCNGCEEVASNLVNLEYIIFYPFNHGLNTLGCQFTAELANKIYDHQGDMTFINLVYDNDTDQIIRAAFSAHGVIMQAYDLTNRSILSFAGPIQNIVDTVDVKLLGTDPVTGGPISVAAKKVDVLFHFLDPGPSINEIFETVNFYQPEHNNNYVFFVPDPETGQFEHIVAYIEWGSHEVYPAPDGNVACMPSHDGNGSSFLPEKVTYLGTMDQLLNDPRFAQNAPFVFFNGKWGTDPDPAIVHNEWYYPHNRTTAGVGLNYACLLDDPGTKTQVGSNNPFPGLYYYRFDDRSPYNLGGWDSNTKTCTPSALTWPPDTGPHWDIASYNLQTELVAGQCLNGAFVIPPPTCLSNIIFSQNHRYELWVQNDGNLVLYDVALLNRLGPYHDASLWASCTNGYENESLVMQPDGNLVLYQSLGRARFATGTNNHPGAYLVLQDDGNLVVYDSDNTTVLWASNSGASYGGQSSTYCK